jgi:3D (Asp-Asp-Asp) domain-containing protein
MRRIVMSIALLAGLAVSNAGIVGVPPGAISRLLLGDVAPVLASTASLACLPRHAALLPVSLPRFEVVRSHGYVIPADHPQPPEHMIRADHPRPPLGRFKLTPYSGPQLRGKVKAITASGTAARAGRTVAVDPKVIPLGSRVYIEGIGERIAEDVGGAVKGRHIDVYLASVPQAIRFGVQRAIVSVVAPPKDLALRSRVD